MCADGAKSQCVDAYSECIQGGDDSAHCQGVVSALCAPDGGGDAGDGRTIDAGDAGDGSAGEADTGDANGR